MAARPLPGFRKEIVYLHIAIFDNSTDNVIRIIKDKKMLLSIAVILAILWLLGFLVFHILGGLIHIVLILALLALVAHFFKGRKAV